MLSWTVIVWPCETSCQLSKELHTNTTSTVDKHHNTCQTVYPQLLQPVAVSSWGRLAQLFTFCQERGFFYSGPAVWNTLPSVIHDITDTSTSRKRLKSALFDHAYHWLLLALLDVSYSGGLQISHWLIDWSVLCYCTASHHTRHEFTVVLCHRQIVTFTARRYAC